MNEFSKLIDTTHCHMDRFHLKMTCILSEAEVELAKNGFNATVIVSFTIKKA
jgi:hypothetical protein